MRRAAWLTVALLVLAPGASWAADNVVFQDTYDAGLAQWQKHGGCYAYSVSTVQDPVDTAPTGCANRVVRMINRMGEDNRTCTGVLGQQYAYGYKRRAELMPNSPATHALYKQSHWSSQRLLIPESWPTTQPSALMTLSQLIAAFPGMQGTDMKLSLSRQQRWRVEIRTALTGWKLFDLGPITRGVWTRWVVHYKRSKDPDGIAQVWRDGTLVVDYRGPTTYTAHPAAVWKHGIYVSAAENTAEYVLYFDDVTIAQGPGQYAAVSASWRP